MYKYWIIIKNQMQRQLVYRETILSYAVGNLLELSLQVIVWSAIYAHIPMISGYTKDEMITYIAFGWFFMFFTTNYNLEYRIADHIQRGQLSQFLLKPQSYLKYMAAINVGRVSVPLIAVILQCLAAFLLLRNELIIPEEISIYPALAAMMLAVFLLKFLISALIGMAAFWTTEIDGIYYSIDVVIRFLSGGFFPLTLFPGLFAACKFLPFMHTFFVPAQLFLGRMGIGEAALSLLVQSFWIIVFYAAVKLAWRAGLKRYEAVGI